LPVKVGSPNVDRKISALERAFQLARSGRVAKVDDIRKQLKQEGYNESAVDGGPSLQSQLRELIKAAHLRPGALDENDRPKTALGVHCDLAARFPTMDHADKASRNR